MAWDETCHAAHACRSHQTQHRQAAIEANCIASAARVYISCSQAASGNTAATYSARRHTSADLRVPASAAELEPAAPAVNTAHLCHISEAVSCLMRSKQRHVIVRGTAGAVHRALGFEGHVAGMWRLQEVGGQSTDARHAAVGQGRMRHAESGHEVSQPPLTALLEPAHARLLASPLARHRTLCTTTAADFSARGTRAGTGRPSSIAHMQSDEALQGRPLTPAQEQERLQRGELLAPIKLEAQFAALSMEVGVSGEASPRSLLAAGRLQPQRATPGSSSSDDCGSPAAAAGTGSGATVGSVGSDLAEAAASADPQQPRWRQAPHDREEPILRPNGERFCLLPVK